jgi:hypothetical protein
VEPFGDDVDATNDAGTVGDDVADALLGEDIADSGAVV